MGKFIDIKFLPAPKNDGGGQASGQKLKSMAGNARAEKPGYQGVFSGRPLERQEVVEILDVWDKESSWRAKETSPEQGQVRKLLDGLCQDAHLDMSSLKAFKNQFLLDRDFSPAVDEGVMRMEVFLVPAGSDETAFEHEMIAALGALDISTGWGLEESECDGRGWRALLMLTKWESLAQSESVLGASSQSLRAITMDRAGAKSLVHHIKWKNPLAQAGLAVSGGTNQRG